MLKNYVFPVYQDNTRSVSRDSTNSPTLHVLLVIFLAVAYKIVSIISFNYAWNQCAIWFIFKIKSL